MPRPKNPIPLPRPHSSGQARVTIEGKDYLLGGPLGSATATANYQRLIAQLLAKEGPFAVDQGAFTIKELAAAYWLHASKYYGYEADPRRGDGGNLKQTLAILVELYGDTEAKAFGPLDLRAVQGEMIRGKVINGEVVRVGWCRNMVNRQIGRIKQVFKWSVGEELVPASVWHTLQAVPGLRRGKTEARESAPVRPVDKDDVERVKGVLRPVIVAMLRFMELTGCRPNEVCQLRPCDLDKSNERCWVFKPQRSKTDHYGRPRLILIGPQCQEVIRSYLEGIDPTAFAFSPRREEEARNAERRDQRQTKLTPSAIARLEAAKRRQRRRPPADCYTTLALRRAIDRACRSVGIKPFGPNRLRHNRATELRGFGLDVVGAILGHSRLETTQVYSERNLEAAMKVIEEVG